MKSLKDDPRQEKYNNILVGTPTFGQVSINFATSLSMMSNPIFTARSLMPVLGKPVDVARNEIAQTAILGDYAYVLFRDDDVIADYDCLGKLIGRLSSKQKANPKDIGESIVGGVVYSKTKPPSPMIYRHKGSGGFEDWNFGDLVECDSIGMGCTLIPIGVFKKILADGLNEFQCVNSTCETNWSVVYDKAVEKCPICESKLAPVFFKTIRTGEEMDWGPSTLTEDTYFCLLSKDSGVGVYADCGVQCKHECSKTQTVFYYKQELGLPVWECNGRIEFWPRLESDNNTPLVGKVIPDGKKNGKVKFNLGSGAVHKKGYINVDLNTDADFKCDIRDLRPLVTKYGQADEIYSSHAIEHVNRNAVTTTVRNWLKALKPGGRLKFRAPDAMAAMKDFIDSDNNGDNWEDYYFKEAVIFGAQRYPGDAHLTAITENKIKKVISSCRHMIENYKIETGRFKDKNQDEVVVTITKKKAKKKEK